MNKTFLKPISFLVFVLLSGCSGEKAACKEAQNAYTEYKTEGDKRQAQDEKLLKQTRIDAALALSDCDDPSFREKNGIRSRFDCVDYAASFLLKESYFKPGEVYRLANKVIENNPQCFTPQQVAEAQDQLERSLRWKITIG